jgi:predicted  nucleic acid-binding Zn-ribbon protein
MANNNEAKIKFTAETGEFNENIKKADKTLGNLRAELNLNETQMKATGATVEGLEKKHSILERQLASSRSKTEALSSKIEVATRLFGENSNEVLGLREKLLRAQAAEERVKQALSKCTQELDAQKAAAKEASSAIKKLTDTIDDQQAKVDDLKAKYKEAVLQYGKNSKEARTLAKQLKNLSEELSDSKRKMNDADRAADKLDKSLDDAGDSARASEGGFTVMKGAISDLVSEAIQLGIGKLGEFIGYLKELPEATRELRQDMATLDTSFQRAGFSTEQATQTWKDLYTIFGEEDRAVEAANLIAKMSDNQEELNEWVTITKGVWGTYQDSLPVEGLAEASNETAKTGQVTGVLADALNWSGEAAKMFSKYMGEDVTTAEDAFNEALKECSTEQERQQLITDTLRKLYGDAATAYDEASGAQLKEKEAAAEATLAQNNLAAAVAPATTEWTKLKTQLITAVTPAITTVCGWLSKAFSWLQQHPAAMTAVAAAVSALGAALTVLAVAMAIATVKQWLMNAAILANPITWIVVGIVAAVAALIAVGVALYKNWDTIKAKCSDLWNGVKKAFNGIKNAIMKPINAAKDGVKKAIDKIKGFFSGLKLKLPKIKLPHFKIKGSFSLSPPSVPKLSIDWYAKGAIFTRPTIFPTASGFKGVGDVRGGEAVLPIDRLKGYVAEAIMRTRPAQDLTPLVDAIEELASRPIDFNINGRRFAQATAGDTDSVNGVRNSLIERGLVLD